MENFDNSVSAERPEYRSRGGNTAKPKKSSDDQKRVAKILAKGKPVRQLIDRTIGDVPEFLKTKGTSGYKVADALERMVAYINHANKFTGPFPTECWIAETTKAVGRSSLAGTNFEDCVTKFPPIAEVGAILSPQLSQTVHPASIKKL